MAPVDPSDTAPLGDSDSSSHAHSARPVSAAWLQTIDSVAATVLGPHDRVGDALVNEVAGLSELYTRGRGALREQSTVLAARLRFFLPRDLPKIEGPLSELAWAGAFPGSPGAALRVLDLGAGLGTTTLGVATLAARLPARPSHLEVIAVERDARSLDVMQVLAARCGRGILEGETVPVQVSARELDLERGFGSLRVGERFDLIVMGLALNELFTDRAHDERIERRAHFLSEAASRLAPGGALVVIEPALRDATRELQEVRGSIATGQNAYVFGPCTHDEPCPLLVRERDWCHEDLPLCLPEPLATLARSAGLRFEGLTYSYLTLRAERLRCAPGASRVVGGPLPSKGKCEWELCTPQGALRAMRLDREREAAGEDVGGRGSLLQLTPSPAGPRVRLGRDATVRSLRKI